MYPECTIWEANGNQKEGERESDKRSRVILIKSLAHAYIYKHIICKPIILYI